VFSTDIKLSKRKTLDLLGSRVQSGLGFLLVLLAWISINIGKDIKEVSHDGALRQWLGLPLVALAMLDVA
jgi:hypothetical protein